MKKTGERRPYADDWQHLPDDVWYSPTLKLYWKDGVSYDLLSAEHNGIVGTGAEFKRLIKGVGKPIK